MSPSPRISPRSPKNNNRSTFACTDKTMYTFLKLMFVNLIIIIIGAIMYSSGKNDDNKTLQDTGMVFLVISRIVWLGTLIAALLYGCWGIALIKVLFPIL